MGQNKIIPNEKIAICYTCCGPTYRKSAKEKLENVYYDDDNIYYFVLTDDKKYFEGIQRKNLYVNELKDFYPSFPELEKNEWFLESETAEEYGKKFIELKYKFPFSTNRFHFLQASPFGITNIIMLSTDSQLVFSNLNENLGKKNILFNAVSRWRKSSKEKKIQLIVNMLKQDFNLDVNEEVWVYDGAVKFFQFEGIGDMFKLFMIWNNIMKSLYENDLAKIYMGTYAVNDECILAPILDALKITCQPSFPRLFEVKHNIKLERFWSV